MLKRYGQLLALLLLCKILVAQNIMVKPYLQNASPHEMTIMWETANNGTGQVYYGIDPQSLTNSQTSISISGSGSSMIHTCTIATLTANKTYYYKIVMEGGQQTHIYSFKTPAHVSHEKATQLVAISDMQRDNSHPNKFKEIIEEGIIPIVQTEVDSSMNELEAVIIPGDLVATGGNYDQWKDHFFNPSDSLFPYVLVYPVPGNHEYYGGGLSNFLKYFTLPENGPSGLEEQCWYKDISNIRLIGLNSNSGSSDQNLQLNWLSEILDSTCNNNDIDFVFAQLHHPHKSELWTPGEIPFTGMVIDSLETFTSNCNKASIHFFGHTHGYSRGQSRDHKHLWINVATAGGAIDNWGEFPNEDYEEFVKSQDEYGFVLMDVDAGSEPKFTLRRYSRGDQDTIYDNVLRDELTIYKNEWKPAQPENIFPANNDTIMLSCLVLKGSEFFGIEDSIQASHWQIASGNNFSDSLVTSTWFQNENFYYEVNLQEDDILTDATFSSIPANNNYYWRVRYRDKNLEWSPWSESTKFYLESGGDILSGNLILNNGAEVGIDHWSGDIESLNNGECNSVSPYLGDHNFAVGGVCNNESSVGIAKQTIDLSPYSNEINSNEASARFGAFMRNFSGSDIPEMYLEFYANNTLLLSTLAISNSTSTWTYVEDLVSIPVSSTKCVVLLKGTRNAGHDNDSYFDELSLSIELSVDCIDCYGSSNIDSDLDGFCDDIDCDDNDSSIYPGAIELCDTKDNNCDGISDNGEIVSWTGAGGDNLWGNPNNWDQLMVPLACQYVLIDNAASVTIDSAFVCKGIEIGANNSLIINSDAFLNVNSQEENSIPSVIIHGNMIINGRFDVRSSAVKAIDLYGILINNNKMNSFYIQEESIMIRTGGRFESNGISILR